MFSGFLKKCSLSFAMVFLPKELMKSECLVIILMLSNLLQCIESIYIQYEEQLKGRRIFGCDTRFVFLIVKLFFF